MSKNKKKAAKKKLADQPTIGKLASESLGDGNVIDLQGVLLKRADGVEISVPEDLYARCRNKAGMSNEMIITYPDVEALLEACNRIHPRSNPAAFPKEGSAPKSVQVEDEAPDSIEFDSCLEAKFISINRPQYDESHLRAQLRGYNRRYGAKQPVKIVKTVTFKQVSGKDNEKKACKVFVTHYEVYYK